MSVSIKDVARTANCSIKTVSRVINDEPNVTDETRVRVLAAIRSVGYSPNLSARRLVQNKSHMVCILLYPGENQSASAILSKMVDISNDENYEVLIQPYFPGNRRSQNKLIELITAHHVDGFVTTPPCDSDEFISDLFTTYKVPQVQIDPIHHNESIPSVCGDDFKGAYSITEHLIQLGHKHIAFLRGPRNLRSSFDRLAGYRAALEHYDVLIDPGWIENSEFTFDGGHTATTLLLRREISPTAIFAGNDEAAYGAMYAIHEHGLRIPEQISVCGYEDNSLSKFIWPGLTTIHQPMELMMDMATRMLIRILKNETVEENHSSIPARLMIRGSTSSPESNI